MKKSLMFIAAILIFSLLFTAPGCTSGASNPGNQNQNQQGNIVGSWATGDSIITFNPDGTYIQTVQGITFDTGTYTASGGQCTMASRGGHTSTGSYRVSGNTLTGFTDSSGRLTTYSRTSSPPGNVGYEYWKGDIPNACYILNCDGESTKTNW